MSWLPLAIVSYFFSGLSATVDKVLLKARIPNPVLYAFYTGIFSIFVLLLAPFGFSFLSPAITIIALASGASILIGLGFFYAALQRSEASIIVPLVGAFSPIFILLLTNIFEVETLGTYTLIAFIFFVLGGVFLVGEVRIKSSAVSKQIIAFVLLAALFIALTFFFSKLVFQRYPFVDGFIWTRLGSFFFALFFLLVPYLRREIKYAPRTTPSSFGLFFINKGIGATSFLLLNLSIALGPVSIINALRGLEYLFVFIITFLLTFFAPSILKESFHRRDAVQKVLGIISVGIGFIFLWLA